MFRLPRTARVRAVAHNCTGQMYTASMPTRRNQEVAAKRASRRPPPAYDLVVADARAQVDSDKGLGRGRCSLDRRFAWRLLRANVPGLADECANGLENLQDDSEWPALGTEASDRKVREPGDLDVRRRRREILRERIASVRGAVLSNPAVTTRVLEILHARLRGTRARAVVTGTTAVRCALIKHGCPDEDVSIACPPDTDVDIDVCADSDEARYVACERLNKACADILSDDVIANLVATAAASSGTILDRSSRTRSCVYVSRGSRHSEGVTGDAIEEGGALRVDVPSLGPRGGFLRFGCLYVTRNDTLDNGVVLYRLRLCGRVMPNDDRDEDHDSGGTRVHVPLMDIKTFVSTERPIATQRLPLARSCRETVSVPCDRHICVELSRLLTRYYDNVDVEKDEMRRMRLGLLERYIRRTKLVSDDIRSDVSSPEEERAQRGHEPAEQNDTSGDVDELDEHTPPGAESVQIVSLGSAGPQNGRTCHVRRDGQREHERDTHFSTIESIPTPRCPSSRTRGTNSRRRAEAPSLSAKRTEASTRGSRSWETGVTRNSFPIKDS